MSIQSSAISVLDGFGISPSASSATYKLNSTEPSIDDLLYRIA